MPFLIALLLFAPLIPLVAHFPQSPDGAEMVSAALNGGVLHPSGIPLQAWVNYFFVQLLPMMKPGYVLSFVSLIGGYSTVVVFLFLLRRLHVRTEVGALAAAGLVYSPVFMLMSITPEKYTWLAMTQMFFVYRLAIIVLERDASLRNLLWLGLALGLAFAQHSANIILLPPFLYVLGRAVVTAGDGRSLAIRNVFVSLSLAVGVTAFFYMSLLWQRSSLPWPDWGQLETVTDVWNHVVRQDYGVVNLYNNAGVGENSISAPGLLFKGMLAFHLWFWFVPFGMYAAFREWGSRTLMGYLWLIILPGIAVLASTKMPSGDFNTVMGYQERYPILVLPLLAVFWAWGWSYLVERWGKFAKIFWGVGAAFMAVHAAQGLSLHSKTDNNIVEVYREQAGRELSIFAIFWTGSDMTAFYGIPPDAQADGYPEAVMFPLKNLFGMEWYREKTVPRLAPPLARILHAPSPPNSLEDLVRKSLAEGFELTLTEPTKFLQHSDIMATAEQTGVLWKFNSTNNSLYTQNIVKNTVSLCGLFPKVWYGLPVDGLWFIREYLDSFKFAFLSAGDFFQSTAKLEQAAAARAVAEVLVPGRDPEEWIAKCEPYTKLVAQ